MRNVFDQYQQPENRLTHVLACTLSADRALLIPFLRWLGVKHIPPVARLRIVEQQVPGAEVSGDEEEGRGLPDTCIADADGWAVLFECKVQAGINADQIRRHIATARRHGYDGAPVVLLSVDPPTRALPDGVIARQWREVYATNGRHDAGFATTLAERIDQDPQR